MSMSRVLILLVFTVSTMSTLGHAQSTGRTTRQPAIDLTRIDALNRNVVAADFNGDGIIDLAGSSASFAGISSTSARPAAGTNISTSAGTNNGVTLASGNTLRGFDVGNTTGSKLSGGSVGTLIVSEMTLSGSGQALNLSSGTFGDAAGAGSGSTFESITSTSLPRQSASQVRPRR